MNRFIVFLRDWMRALANRIRFQRTGNSTAEQSSNPSSEVTPRSTGTDRFGLYSWMITLVIVVVIIGSAIWWDIARADRTAALSVPTASPDGNTPPAVPQNHAVIPVGMSSIERNLQLKTDIPERPRYDSLTYRVSRGDAMLAIAEKFKVKTETILYVNKEVLDDNPHSLRPGMELLIPPVDGIYHEWEAEDTLESVAEEFDADPEEILNFPGNKVDLTNPAFETGDLVMIPGGSRELRDWTQDLATAGRSNTGSTGTSDFGTNVCGGGPVSSGFGWPADDHAISGNGYSPGHLGIDISAPEGASVYAAGDGIVTMAQGGYNYGYGNVVQIDHGGGYVTVYAHLSQINVGVCTPVGRGTLVGLSGSTGNAFGAHLHFEIRVGGSNINPMDIVQ